MLRGARPGVPPGVRPSLRVLARAARPATPIALSRPCKWPCAVLTATACAIRYWRTTGHQGNVADVLHNARANGLRSVHMTSRTAAATTSNTPAAHPLFNVTYVPGRPVTVIAVASQKGGVGKTTVAMTFAAAFAHIGYKVLLVDIDPQASAYDMSQLMGDACPYQVVHEVNPAELATLRDIGGVELIFVDCPGHLENAPVLGTVVKSADSVIIPYPHQIAAMQMTVNTVDFVNRAAAEAGREVPCWVLLNNIDAHWGYARIEDAWRTLDQEGIRSFRSYLRAYQAYPDAQALGIPLIEMRGGSMTRVRDNLARVIEDFDEIVLGNPRWRRG